MSGVIRRTCFIRVVRVLSVTSVFAASICFALDKRQPDATMDEDDINS